MTRSSLNRLCARLPVLMSLLAFALVMFALVTGWEARQQDEGAAAHIFQLLIVAQAPLVLLFLAMADWRRLAAPARALLLQAGALLLAFAPVAIFRL